MQGEIERTIDLAQRKLERIITAEGDDNGKRREPEYLANILREVINEQRAMQKLNRGQ